MRSANPAPVLVLTLGLGLLGCDPAVPRQPPPRPPASTSAPPAAFDNITARSGLDFRHQNGASERRLLPETMGGGVAVLDHDGDGWSDLAFADSGDLERGGAVVLVRNLGGGRFAPPGPRLPTPDLYVLGLAVGDFDNDGDADLAATGVGRQRLFENRGDGSFAELPASHFPVTGGFGSSAAFFDANGDGGLDLVIGRYVRWSPARDVACKPDGVRRAYCTPEVYPGDTNLFFSNQGGGRFVERGAAAGLALAEGKTLGLVAGDLDGDGDVDLAVANDTSRNFLFLNQGRGTFREVAVEAGFAFSESGATRGGMGIDAGDLDGDGRVDLVVGNFAQEMSAFYRALPAPSGEGVQYVDDAAQTGLGLPTLLTLAFGTLVFDYDGDGDLDVAIANGHIEPEIATIRRGQSYAQPVQLFANDGGGHFSPMDADAASALAIPRVGRGLASGDFDRDGDPDLVLTTSGGPAELFENKAGKTSWLRFEMIAASGSATVYGARARVEMGGKNLERELSAGRSYLSASEVALTVGVRVAARMERLELKWPSGQRRVFLKLPAGLSYHVKEEASPNP